MAGTVGYPWELDQGEGHNVWSGWLLMHGRGPYLDLNYYPFFDINYPPLHYVMMIPLLAVFGPSLVAGRLLADLCIFGLAGGVAAIVWRYTRSRPETGLGALLILANPYLYVFGTLATVNVSQVMLGVWGLYWLGQALDEVGPDGAVMAAPVIKWPPLIAGLSLLLAALYTKQQALDAVVAGFAFLLWRRPKIALLSGLVFGAIGGSLFLLIDRLTVHQFYINLVKVNLNDFIRRQLVEQITAYAQTHAPLLLLAAAYAAFVIFSRARFSLWLAYFLSTTAFSVAVGKFGASETYFYSSIAAVAIAASLVVGRFQRSGVGGRGSGIGGRGSGVGGQGLENRDGELEVKAQELAGVQSQSTIYNLQSTILLLLLLCQIVLFFHTPETPHPWKDLIKGQSGNYGLFGGLPTEGDRVVGQRLADTIRAASPPVLTEEASFAMINGYEVVTNPSNLLVYDQAGLWQGRQLTQMVQDRCFSLLLLHGHFLPQIVQIQMQASYRLTQTEKLNGGTYEIWSRLSPPATGSTACAVANR